MSVQVCDKITVLPAVPAERHGTGYANTMRSVRDENGRLDWVQRRRGRTHLISDMFSATQGQTPGNRGPAHDVQFAEPATSISQSRPLRTCRFFLHADPGHVQIHAAGSREGATPAAIAYDFAANMTKATPDKAGDWTKGYNLKWDAWNRLVEVRRQGDDTHVATYHYDGLFRRTHSTVDGTDRHFIYDRAWRILEERPGSETATPDRLYTWGLRHRTDMVCRDADLPAAVGSGSDSGETGGSASTSTQRHYVTYDWISPTAILDPTTGDPVDRYSYSAFGQWKVMDSAYAERGASDYSWRFLFHGQFVDIETGWMNYGYRHYSATAGRWLSRDRIAERGGRNMYCGASNNFATRKDHLGLKSFHFDEKNCTLTMYYKLEINYDDSQGAWNAADKATFASKLESQIENRFNSNTFTLKPKNKTGKCSHLDNPPSAWSGYGYIPHISWCSCPCPCPNGIAVKLNIGLTNDWEDADVEAGRNQAPKEGSLLPTDPAGTTKVDDFDGDNMYISYNDAVASKQTEWGPGQNPNPLGQDAAAHEFGHLLGLTHPGHGLDWLNTPNMPDQMHKNWAPYYHEGTDKDGRSVSGDDLMGVGNGLRSFYFDQWKNFMNTQEPKGCDYEF